MSSIVLVSGGLDSAVLLADELLSAPVQPVYVRCGLAWEVAEEDTLDWLLETTPFRGCAAPLVCLELSLRDVYPPGHWAIRGEAPAYDTEEEAVYLAGRNLTLLTKAGLLAASRGATRVILGTLGGNPFHDATPQFYAAMQQALSVGFDQPFEIAAPFAALHKPDVIKKGRGLGVNLARTLSCLDATLDHATADHQWRHCGRCSKCRERQQAFHEAGVADDTIYLAEGPWHDTEKAPAR